MRVLIFWDIYGRIGRNALLKELPALKETYQPTFIIANVDNISSGRWAIEKHVLELERAWVDVMTSGDHIFDNIEKITDYLNKTDSKLIRAANYYENEQFKIPGKGYKILEKNGQKLLLIHFLSNNGMRDAVYNPFLKLGEILSEQTQSVDATIVDFHKEFTSEIYGMAMSFDGQLSFCYGTHTHVQSNDEFIFDAWTGVMNDVGMSGSLYSVIGADLRSVKGRFFTGINKGKIEQSLDPRYVVHGVVVDIEDGKCVHIEKLRLRGRLVNY